MEGKFSFKNPAYISLIISVITSLMGGIFIYKHNNDITNIERSKIKITKKEIELNNKLNILKEYKDLNEYYEFIESYNKLENVLKMINFRMKALTSEDIEYIKKWWEISSKNQNILYFLKNEDKYLIYKITEDYEMALKYLEIINIFNNFEKSIEKANLILRRNKKENSDNLIEKEKQYSMVRTIIIDAVNNNIVSLIYRKKEETGIVNINYIQTEVKFSKNEIENYDNVIELNYNDILNYSNNLNSIINENKELEEIIKELEVIILKKL